MKKQTVSWGMVALAYFVFLPAGIWLTVQKINGNGFSYCSNGKLMQYSGWFLCFVGMVYVAMAMSGQIVYEDGTSVGPLLWVFGLPFFAGGIALVIKGKKLYSQGTKYQRYVRLVHTIGQGDLKKIAEHYPTSQQQVAMDLQNMLELGYFAGGHLDLEQNRLVFANAKANTVQIGAVRCPNCGAFNQNASLCEYCNSPLGTH